jgi:uncharacterized protein (UPF0305 family)
MGRGRRGIIEQSQKKPKINLVQRKNANLYCPIGGKKINYKIALPCEFIQNLKKMDPKDVAEVLLLN